MRQAALFIAQLVVDLGHFDPHCRDRVGDRGRLFKELGRPRKRGFVF